MTLRNCVVVQNHKAKNNKIDLPRDLPSLAVCITSVFMAFGGALERV